jgi:hypothetical protein
MSFYRKKSVIIEAHLVSVHNLEVVSRWCGGQVKGMSLPPNERYIGIQTLEGEMRAEIGSYIIKGIKGEFYPCRAGIFEETYERFEG